MATFSVNQNRQLYVVKSLATESVTSKSEVGTASAHTTLEGQVFLKYMGKGGLTRTDLVPKDLITFAKVTAPYVYKTKGYKVTLCDKVNGGEPISGQDYVFEVRINNYIGFSDEDVYLKYGCVHAHTDMTASDFYKEMVISLVKNFSREITPMCKFYLETADGAVEVETASKTEVEGLDGEYTGILVYEVEQPWELGTRQVNHVNFEVKVDEVLFEGCQRNWGKVVEDDSQAEDLGNGKEMADLEYFCMGEKGDQYRGINWPYVMKTEYMVDPSKQYYSVDVHYSFVDAGVSVQKSEKTITFLTTSATVANAILAKFK
jgi:hypothetical protein